MSLSMKLHPEVTAFLDKVCAQVRAKEVHEDIRVEMLSHLEELAAEKAAQGGMSEEEAIAEALRQMGDPERIGKQLHAAHKPKPEWGIIALVAGMIVIGLVSLYALHLSLDGNLLISRKLVCGFVGVAAMIVLYFTDYRRLLRYSMHLYIGVILLMVAVRLEGEHVNGAAQWLQVGSFGFNVYAVSPYLLIIAIAGMLQREKPAIKEMRHEALRLAKDTAVYMLIPAILYMMAPAFAYFLLYSIGLAVLLLVSGRRKLLFVGFGIMMLMFSTIFLSGSLNTALQRYTAFLHPGAYADSGGYMTLRSVEAVQSGGMWGQGFGIAYGKLPSMSSDMLYSYLVYSLGWLFGIAVAAIALLFIVKIAQMGIKLRDGYAKSLVIGLAAIFGIQYVWNLLMCAGLMPILGFSLPIMNWSSNTIIELAAVGLMLGAYRRKDMLGSHPRRQTV